MKTQSISSHPTRILGVGGLKITLDELFYGLIFVFCILKLVPRLCQSVQHLIFHLHAVEYIMTESPGNFPFNTQNMKDIYDTLLTFFFSICGEMFL